MTFFVLFKAERLNEALSPLCREVYGMAEGRRRKAIMFFADTWSFQPLKKVIRFTMTAIFAIASSNEMSRTNLFSSKRIMLNYKEV